MQTAASEFDQGHSTCTCVLEYELNLVLEYGRTELSGRHVCTLEYELQTYRVTQLYGILSVCS